MNGFEWDRDRYLTLKFAAEQVFSDFDIKVIGKHMMFLQSDMAPKLMESEKALSWEVKASKKGYAMVDSRYIDSLINQLKEYGLEFDHWTMSLEDGVLSIEIVFSDKTVLLEQGDGESA